jgi:transmembrane sensor
MEQETPWHLFFKCFKNQATPQQLAEVDDWLAKDAENLKFLEEVYNIFSISNRLTQPLSPDTSKAWKKVNMKISMNSTPKWAEVLKLWRVFAIAASLIFCVLLFEVVQNYRSDKGMARQFTEVIAMPGQKTSVVLPDSSMVWLNSGSSIRYSSDFNKTRREIIMNGEAYFEVHKNKSKRFRVKSGILDIDVYGTAFNVKNYPDQNIQEVSVTEGIVGLTCNSESIARLTKGEQATLDKKSGKMEINKENPTLVATWKNNELIFRNTSVEEVIKSLESWYGVNINLKNQMTESHNYTFKIKTESFREVMDMIRIMTPLEYKINGKDVEVKFANN